MEKGKIARGLCHSSAVCIFVFVIIGIVSIAGGFMSANGSVNGWTWFLVAAWCTWQTWKLWSANQPGKNIEDHPLFKNAVAGDLGANTGPSNAICMAGLIGFICAVTTKFQEV
ncbi:hypothetical protein TrLO_g3562 [Triparma laevis f. longispina]|uniref:Uncharacterized protein n=1 Tax=Triparma laevis f. longispina TaxID=1714387 RepID=A0A9W6ZHF1_9STRA|nr:hypothetical protein TrLO_g3562 [Triparma laevis f. longispina]